MKEKTKVQSREKDQYDGEEPGVEEYLADLLDKSLTEQERKNVEDASDENVLFYILLKKYWYLLISALLIVALIFLYLYQINPDTNEQTINKIMESRTAGR